MNRRETVERKAAQWARDLTDESGRNRLLYYRDLKVGTLDLAEADSRAVDRLRNGKKVQLGQLFPAPVNDDYLALEFEDQDGNEDQDLLAGAIKRARSISRKAQEYFEEKGIQTLFLGWGMATWTPQTTKATPAAPVLLCPIGLHRKGTAETDYDFELTGEWTLNEALLQHLANEFQVDVSGEDLMDPYGDGEQISPDEEQAIFAELSRRASNVPDFAIAERLIAGNFMYKKMPMVNDIKKNLDALTNHDLIAALAGDEEAVESVRLHSDHPIDPLLPDTLPPADEFLVLNADSSQNAAINAALSGHSFVLQGPPGTGKSQTISNLIATMMAQGKRVLFVAEKRAAIDAVVKRLTYVGLDRFVMDLHGRVPSRRKLAQQLDQSLTDIHETHAVNQQELHQHLQMSRQELSGYAEALHQEREPWGLSYFDVLSGLLRLEASEYPPGVKPQPSMWFSSSALAEIDEATTQQVRRDLKDWIDLSEPLRSGRSPWAGADISSEGEARIALDACFGLSGELTSNWQAQKELLAGKLGISDPGSVANWGDLMAEVPEIARAAAKAEAALTLEVFSADLATLVQHLTPATGSGLEMLSDHLEIAKPRSAVEWGNVIAEVPELARAVAKAEESLPLEVFNQDLDKLVQDMAPATGSALGKLSNHSGFDSRRRFHGGVALGWLGKFLDDLEVVKPRSAAEWGNVMAEIPELARAVAKAEAALTLEVFNHDLDKLVQDMAPATGSGPSQLFNKLFNRRYKSALAELERLKPGLSDINARDLFDEVDSARTLIQRWAELDCPGSPQVLANTEGTIDEIAETAQRYESALSELERLKPGLSDINARDLFDEVEAAHALALRWTELGCSGSPQVLANAIDAADEISEIAQRYQSALSELEGLVPGLSTRSARDLFDEVEAAHALALCWTELGCSGSPQVLVNAVEATEAFNKMKDAVDKLATLLPKDKLADETIEGISGRTHELSNDQHTLFQLPRFHDVEHRLRTAHVGPLLDDVTKGALRDDALETSFDYSRLRSIQREVLLEDSRLSGFQGSRQSRYVGEFQQADTKHIEGNPARVARRIAEHAVTALNQNPGQDQLIRKEAGKKTRHLPLRSLFEFAPEALAAVRPCWAMSPLDVAQTLPPRPLFDLVVFDEASQVLPCDAIPALLRGSRVMVAGDSRQLPPTTFFDSSGGDDDFEEEDESMADYESILDVMDAQLSRRQLTWHYRSQDERLIAYSNQEIYHGSLTTFPGASSDKCLSWELVPHQMGVATKKGSNSDEVLQVVDLMIGHARARPTETLGVIAMGINHANRIEEVLRQRLGEESDPDLEDFFNEANEERAFVKNLERVQGDERDAIILSIGYGKNAEGRMLYNFGPLNREGGERRLNVAISRARKRMTVVSSFDYADMDPEKTRSTGAKMLRGFLKFAQSGGTALDGADAAEPLNPFEIDVLDKLTASGLAVVPQYGCSDYRIDFAVRHPDKPGQFALAVEADGASYHSSHTARDRDRLRQEHLERLGWRFCRIWSTDWFNDHRREVERVLAAYEKAVSEIDSGQFTGPSAPASRAGLSEGPDVGTTADMGEALPQRGDRPWMRRFASSIDDYSQAELVALGRWIESDNLLRTDAQLFEAIFDELPFNRRGAKIKAAIDKAIAAMKRNG